MSRAGGSGAAEGRAAAAVSGLGGLRQPQLSGESHFSSDLK